MAITSNVSSFLNNIKQGVKSNLFLVEFEWPSVVTDGPDNDLANMLCKSAALPASNLGVIEVPFRGRTVKIAGDRTFDTWTVTIINDRNFTIRHGFERWMEAMNTHTGNTADAYIPDQGGTGFLKDLTVKQLERDSTDEGSVLREYKLWGCFPTNVSQIDVAYDSNDQIEDFTVEFQLQYWHAVQGQAAQGGGGITK
jgi:hypothetical protein|tara:strand:+ start:665 stop:1255 length:591 start_codon:yes stop_codon:yes gene_type:complete